MKKLKNFPVTNYHQFPQKYYFLSIVNNIIKIANLTKTKKIILDYGCGNRIFSKILQNKKIINYDINPLLSSEIRTMFSSGIRTTDRDIIYRES